MENIEMREESTRRKDQTKSMKSLCILVHNIRFENNQREKQTEMANNSQLSSDRRSFQTTNTPTRIAIIPVGMCE